jgi:hypothetical protein
MVKIVKSFTAQTFAADIRKVKQVSQGEQVLPAKV